MRQKYYKISITLNIDIVTNNIKMNEFITTTNKNANSLLIQSGQGETIDISHVKEITGSVCEIMEIISSNNFTGYGNQDLVLTGNLDSEELSLIHKSTTGTVTQI